MLQERRETQTAEAREHQWEQREMWEQRKYLEPLILGNQGNLGDPGNQES
jgi:hypothetical protein